MKFIADENIDFSIIASLRNAGYEVISISEISPRISDDQVLTIANQEKAVLITDDKDFGELVFRQRKISRGVILCRLAGLETSQKANKVVTSIEKYQNQLFNSFSVIDHKSIRIRKT